MRYTAPVAILSAVIGISALLVFLAAGYETARNLGALVAGASAYSLMALNLLLATRAPVLEQGLGGLDQVYRLHKWTGITILACLLVHTQLKFVQLEGLVPPGSLAETAVSLAKPAFLVLALLIVLSAVKRLPRLKAEIPWMWWRVTHWLVIPVFLVITFHQVFVKAPFDSLSAIRIWLYGAGGLGLGAILWIVLAPWLRKRRYEVVRVTQLPGATQVTARPLRGALAARPGQFAYLSADRAGLREPHPFTLSRMGPSGTVEFCIQPAGDFTRRLRQTLQPGDRLRVEGGYGRFDFRRGGQRQIWLAGGIGITPFLAMADAFAADPGARSIVLVHAVRSADLAIDHGRLTALAQAQPGFAYHLHDSATHGRLTGEKLAGYVPFSVAEADLWYCGPKALRKSVLEQWRALGQRPRAVHFEEFEFR